ncbi:MAG: 1-acyl-sn-glycerol-3-phosphate acyltransferase [Deferribacteraceae bacterium]|jgi:1-acyl-sn-glycerol-3-phosphate acyltransferase|nr:1-acyl-sn-glycerol-3-phosphate acyltransferase [Deferribacteraceae bacterium]
MTGSFFRWIGLAVIFGYYAVSGILRAPFGAAGIYYRSIVSKFGKYMLAAAGGKAIFEGLDNLDPKKHYVFVGNHQSYADIFLLLAALNTLNMGTIFMLKKELFKIPFLGSVAKYMGMIPIENDESRKALKTVLDAVKALEKGISLTIFPEGSRSKDGEIISFKRGAFLIAGHTGMPIVPFAITGTADVMPCGNLNVKPGLCRISFLPPVMPGNMPSKELASSVEDIVRNEYNRLRFTGKTEGK